MKYIYLIIPTICGEINGDAIVSLYVDFVPPLGKEYLFSEVTIYRINLNTLEVIEV